MIQTSTRPEYRRHMRNLRKMLKHGTVTKKHADFYEDGIRQARRTAVIDDNLEGRHDKR